MLNLLLLCPLLAPQGVPVTQTLVLPAVLDNTLYLANLPNISNGKGQHLFVGVNSGGSLRRACLKFDLAGALPAGSSIQSVRLEVNLSKAVLTLAKPVEAHRLLGAFGEGTSDAAGEEGGGAFATPGDSTWTLASFPSLPWQMPGGDFSPVVSSAADVFDLGFYAWPSTPQLVADAQFFLDQPQSNFGWILVGPEELSKTAMRFDSRENPLSGSRPRLVVEFLTPGSCTSAAAQQVPRLGTPPNPLALSAFGGNGPVVGQYWWAQVDHQSFATWSIADLLVVSAAATEIPTANGTLLVDLAANPLFFPSAPGLPVLLPVPAKCTLVGAQVFAQAASFGLGGEVALTNALDLVIGAP
jgi:hypothetical protein